MKLKVPIRGDGTGEEPLRLKYSIQSAGHVWYFNDKEYAIVELPDDKANKWLEKDDIEEIEFEVHRLK